jgi:hypothetical protein
MFALTPVKPYAKDGCQEATTCSLTRAYMLHVNDVRTGALGGVKSFGKMRVLQHLDSAALKDAEEIPGIGR